MATDNDASSPNNPVHLQIKILEQIDNRLEKLEQSHAERAKFEQSLSERLVVVETLDIKSSKEEVQNIKDRLVKVETQLVPILFIVSIIVSSVLGVVFQQLAK